MHNVTHPLPIRSTSWPASAEEWTPPSLIPVECIRAVNKQENQLIIIIIHPWPTQLMMGGMMRPAVDQTVAAAVHSFTQARSRLQMTIIYRQSTGSQRDPTVCVSRTQHGSIITQRLTMDTVDQRARPRCTSSWWMWTEWDKKSISARQQQHARSYPSAHTLHKTMRLHQRCQLLWWKSVENLCDIPGNGMICGRNRHN